MNKIIKDNRGGTEIEVVLYRGYRIEPKLDFGREKQTGFVVTDGQCNIMPAGCWFSTVDGAKRGIRVFKTANRDADKFWETLQPFEYTKIGQKSDIKNGEVQQGRFWAKIENHRVVALSVHKK